MGLTVADTVAENDTGKRARTIAPALGLIMALAAWPAVAQTSDTPDAEAATGTTATQAPAAPVLSAPDAPALPSAQDTTAVPDTGAAPAAPTADQTPAQDSATAPAADSAAAGETPAADTPAADTATGTADTSAETSPDTSPGADPAVTDDAPLPAGDATDIAADGDIELPLADLEPETGLEMTQAMVLGASQRARQFLVDGGPSIWAIAALSVITVALILWKTWRFFLSGAWSKSMSRRAIELWEAGKSDAALAVVESRRGLRSRMTAAAMRARLTLSDSAAREETSRVAKRLLAGQGGGLRALELIATIAPLLGLLGTVLGIIAAFQALQAAGNRADPALLAGGIWEALLTTAAGMAVAIPASAALTWFEAVIDNVRTDMEDLAARIFIAPVVQAELPDEAPTRLAAQ